MLCCYILGNWVAFVRLASLKTHSTYQLSYSISYKYVLGLKTETCLLNLKICTYILLNPMDLIHTKYGR